MKRHRFLQEDTLSKRITEACKSVEKSHFKGFVSHSYKCWKQGTHVTAVTASTKINNAAIKKI